jgi:hypothetical protein
MIAHPPFAALYDILANSLISAAAFLIGALQQKITIKGQLSKCIQIIYTFVSITC